MCEINKQPPEVFYKKDALKISPEEGIYAGIFYFFNKVAVFLTQMFSCKFYGSFKNTYLEEHLWTTVSES